MNSRNLDLSFWEEGNTEPDLVFNALLTAVDALMKSPVESILSTPPSSPEEGQAWIVGSSATGAWAGHDDDVAVAVTGGPGWLFFTPSEGWAFWILDPGASYRYLSGTWSPTGGGALTNPMTGLGDMIYGAADGEPLRVPAGTPGQVPKVQGDGTIAFEDEAGGAGIPVNVQSGTTYTLQESDNGGAVEMTSSSANTVTIPSGLSDGFNCLITQSGTGQTTVVAGSGATLRNPNPTAKVRDQYRSLTIRRMASASTYVLDGYTADS